MELNGWSLSGYVTGLIIVVWSIVRYFTIWIDHSQGVLFIFVGLSIMAFAWIYNNFLKINRENEEKFEKINNELIAIGDKLDDMLHNNGSS